MGHAFRRMAIWLVGILLAIGLSLGQVSDVQPVGTHHAEASTGLADPAAKIDVAVPTCDPGLTCAAFVIPGNPSVSFSRPDIAVLRPDMTRAQRRFGGPQVSLPPPRHQA